MGKKIKSVMLVAGVRNEWTEFIGVKDLYEAKVMMAAMCKVYVSH